MNTVAGVRQQTQVQWSWAGIGRKALDSLYALLWVGFIVVCLRVAASTGVGPMVQRIEVTGAFRYLRPQEVASGLIQVARGPLMGVNLEYLRQVALSVPWVEQARVSRVWPDRIQVLLFERQPVARWKEHSYLSSHGEVFTPGVFMDIQGLPALAGPDGEASYVRQQYLSIAALLRPMNLHISMLRLTERMSWEITLDQGVMIKVDNQDTLAKMQRFAVLYQRELNGQMDRIISVDLRYHNGVAIAWKPELTHRQ